MAGPAPVVDAHDGSVVQDGATFWLFGTAYDCGFSLGKVGTSWCGVRAYSSTDFFHWTDRGYAVEPNNARGKLVALDSSYTLCVP